MHCCKLQQLLVIYRGYNGSLARLFGSLHGTGVLRFALFSKALSAGTRRLGGCIGTFEPLPLPQGLKSYALTAYAPLSLKVLTAVHLMTPGLIQSQRKRSSNLNAGTCVALFTSDASVSLLINFE